MVVPNSCMWRRGDHGVLGDERVAVGRVELHRAPGAEVEVGQCAGPLEVGARRRAVDEHDDLGVAGLDGGDGVLEHELPRRAADAGAVGPRRPQAEVLGDLDRREQRPCRVEPKPSTSSLVSPASAMARLAAWWCRSERAT